MGLPYLSNLSLSQLCAGMLGTCLKLAFCTSARYCVSNVGLSVTFIKMVGVHTPSIIANMTGVTFQWAT